LSGHRHGTGPEHDFEPEMGLPEPLPAGERLLWQGAPDWRALAIRAFHVRKLAVYFGTIAAAHAAARLAQGNTGTQVLGSTLWLAGFALLALGILALMAWLSARTTVYTVTDRRVVMRIGIVLTMTFNLPYRSIESAGLRLFADGAGDLPLVLKAGNKIAFPHLWPHARPWRLAHPEPMLRCVPDAARVARTLADACAQATGGQVLPVRVPEAAEGVRGTDSQPALAGR
jgi:hypothetical protein